jgi:hypothetical protein
MKPGNLIKRNYVSEVGEHWVEKCIHLMYAYIQSVFLALCMVR